MKRTAKAWDVVGDRFESLAAHLRGHFETATAEVGEERKALAKSLTGLASAMEHALLTVGKTVRDPVVRDDVTKTITSVRDALSTSFEELGAEVRTRLPTAEVTKPTKAGSEKAAPKAATPAKAAAAPRKRTPAA